VTRVGDIQITEKNTYLNALFAYQPGDEVSIEFYRNDQKMNVSVVLAEATY